MTSKSREVWGSKIGFILASAGAAVGLGNIQRFPYMVAQHGGGAFVLIYLACVLLLGLPLMLVELSIGREGRCNPVSAIAKLCPKKSQKLWPFAGLLGVLTAFFILSYYSVFTGWTIAYAKMSFQTLPPIADFSANGPQVIFYSLVCLSICSLIVDRGLKKGVEAASKILMPALLITMLVLLIRALTLPGAEAGISFYLNPDFSKLTPEAYLFALGQAFFSLCIGEAVLLSYGSYTTKKDNLIQSAGAIALFDTTVALLAGLVLFPAAFALNQDITQGGSGMIFNIMPEIFSQLPYGQVFSFLFFILLALAAISTCIALLEVSATYLSERWGWQRKVAVRSTAAAAFLVSIPAALSKGASPQLSEINLGIFPHIRGILDIMDFIWGNLGMLLGGLLLALFVGWSWGLPKAKAALIQGCPGFEPFVKPWFYLTKYFIPAIIISIIYQTLSS